MLDKILPNAGESLCNNKARPLQLSYGNRPKRYTTTASSSGEASQISGFVKYICDQIFEDCSTIITFVRMVLMSTNIEYICIDDDDKKFYHHLISLYNSGSSIHHYYLLPYY